MTIDPLVNPSIIRPDPVPPCCPGGRCHLVTLNTSIQLRPDGNGNLIGEGEFNAPAQERHLNRMRLAEAR